MVTAGDTFRRHIVAAGFHQLGGRSADRRVADQWADGHHLRPCTSQSFANIMYREDWSDARYGIAWRNDHNLRLSNRIQYRGKRVGDGVDIGADVQAPDIRIVTYIYDNMNLVFRNDLYQAAQKLGGTGSACQDSVVGGSHPIILRGSQGGRPQVPETFGQEVLNVVDFAVGCLPLEKSENRPSDGFGIRRVLVIPGKIGCYGGKKVFC